MITPSRSLVRVTVTLDAEDVELLDRLAAIEGLNRSAELRSMLGQLRPMLRGSLAAFEAAAQQRDRLDEAAAAALPESLLALLPEVERLQNAYMGAMARIEGAAAAAAATDDDPRPSNHGGHTPPPPPPPPPYLGQKITAPPTPSPGTQPPSIKPPPAKIRLRLNPLQLADLPFVAENIVNMVA